MKTMSLSVALACALTFAADNAAVAPRTATSLQSTVVGHRSSVIGGAEAITIPQMLSYQGKLTDTFGLPVADTTYSVNFRLCTVPSGGSPFWNETQVVRTRGGLFSTLLGSVTPIGSIPDAGAAYLGMAVAGGAELTPRLRIASAAYAYLSERAANADLLQGKDTTALDVRYVNEGQTNSVSSAMITNGTIAAADLNQMGAGTGQVMKWTGSAWAPRNDSIGGGGGGGTVTSVSQTTGVVCTPNPITTTGTVGFDQTYGDGRYVNEAQANSVTGAMITDGQVSSADIRDTTVNTAELKDAAVTAPKLNQMGATTNQVLKWTGSAWAPRNDSVGGGGDNAWVRVGADSVLYTVHQLGIARAGNVLHGTQRFTHTSFGAQCTTGRSGQNMYSATVGGGVANAASNSWSTVGGGSINKAAASYATVGGGWYNTASGQYAAVDGGAFNTAADTYCFVGGGRENAASGPYATVGGGRLDSTKALYGGVFSGYSNLAGDAATDTGAVVCGGYENSATNKYAFVGGGEENLASGAAAFVGAGNQNTASGDYSATGGGRNNSTSNSYATVGGGSGNTASATWATIAGGQSNNAAYSTATIAGGVSNYASGFASTVGGGRLDTTKAVYGGVFSGNDNLAGDAAADTGACVVGGWGNSATAKYASVGGGLSCTASGAQATVGGGYYNSAGGYAATVSGGDRNTASADDATVGGGLQNTASALYAAVGGGRANVAAGRFSTVGGGYADTVKALYGGVLSGYSNLAGDAETDTGATVCGGYGNFAAEYFSVVGGGKNNYAGLVSVVAGGRDNTANGASAVGGGVGNSAVGPYAAIAGGYGNEIDEAHYSFIGAGTGNYVTGSRSVVGGGENNNVSGDHAALVGGNYNMASGDLSMVLGGAYNAARANYTLAAGRYARANHYGGFVWSDQSANASESLYTTGTNQFRVRARGGTWFYSNAAKSTGAYLAPGSNSWESACDSMTKEDFRPVDRKALLDKVAVLRVRDYKMKDQNDGTRHIGPVAQDFHNAFGYGGTETGINLADADGVLLAAVQALYEQNQNQQAEIEALKAKLAGQ